MSTNAPNWFQHQFEREVKLAWQREGSLLRHTVRVRANIRGDRVYFNKAGTAEVQTKSRGGNVPVRDESKTRVICILQDRYLGGYVEELDELKSAADERMVKARTYAAAHGRHTDKLIIEQLTGNSVSQVVGNYGSGLTQAYVQQAIEKLNVRNVPDDRQRYAAITPHAWEELMKIDAFAKSDFVGQDDMPWLSGKESKRWRGVVWMQHSGIPVTSSTKSIGAIWHKDAVGLAFGADLRATWSWENEKSAHFLNTRSSQGCVVVDPDGIVKLQLKHNTSL